MGGDVHAWEDLVGALAAADIVLASTGAREPVLTRALVAKAQKLRRGRPLFLIDIAVPRDVEPSCGELQGIYLADIDDLQKVASSHRDGRRGEAEQAESIVEQELGRFIESFRGRQVGPTVVALRARVLTLAKTEAEKLVDGMPHLAERDRRAILVFRGVGREQAAARAADGAEEGHVGRRRAAGDRGAAAVRSQPSSRPSKIPPTTRPRGRAARRSRPTRRRHRVSPVSSAEKIVIGTRGSALARWQADHITAELRRVHPGLIVEQQIVVTEGDRKQTGPVIELGGKGVWVKEIEEKLLAGDIDLAVHSLKDVPAHLPARAVAGRDPAARRSARRRGQPHRRDAARAAARQPGRHIEPAPCLPAARGAQRSRDRAPARQRRHAAAQSGRGRRSTPRSSRAPGSTGSASRRASTSACRPR